MSKETTFPKKERIPKPRIPYHITMARVKMVTKPKPVKQPKKSVTRKRIAAKKPALKPLLKAKKVKKIIKSQVVPKVTKKVISKKEPLTKEEKEKLKVEREL